MLFLPFALREKGSGDEGKKAILNHPAGRVQRRL